MRAACVLQETFQHSEFRLELLSSVWQAFLYIAESALKVRAEKDMPVLTLFCTSQNLRSRYAQKKTSLC